MRIFRTLSFGLVVVVALGLGSCCSGGSQVKTESKTTTTTLGSELKDLKDAYDQGIISEREYNQAREKLIKERTKGN
ncbi:MAG: SHOCT domain-containing protein [Syntrophobacteraceae bacterium]|nr:SHOCT domain-containing protein [Syntrophobacteraceae bacterium]